MAFPRCDGDVRPDANASAGAEYVRPRLTPCTRSWRRLPGRLAGWLNRHRRDLLGGALLGAGLALGLALGSASVLDEPRLSWPVAEPRENLLGAPGAWVAGRLLYWLGLAAYVPVLALLAAGMWTLLRDPRPNGEHEAPVQLEPGGETETPLSDAQRPVAAWLGYAPWLAAGGGMLVLGVAGAAGDAAPVKPHSPTLGGVLGLALFDAVAALGGSLAARVWLALLAVAGLAIAAWPFVPAIWRGQAAENAAVTAAAAHDEAAASHRSARATGEGTNSEASESGEPTEITEVHAAARVTAEELLEGASGAPFETHRASASPAHQARANIAGTLDTEDDEANRAGEYDTSQLQLPTSQQHRYALPPVSLLPESEGSAPRAAWPHAEQETAIELVEALAKAHVPATLLAIERGPSVVSYELELAARAHLPHAATLEHELSLALRDGSVRVEVPQHAGTTQHGSAKATRRLPRRLRVEVPRHDPEPVGLRELAGEAKEEIRRATLPLILGRDRLGNPLIADLATCGPMLIAAANDAMKSRTIALTVLSLLLAKRPSEAQFVLIDPGGRALAPFEELPQLRRELVRDPQQAVAALYELVAELVRRKRREQEEPDSQAARPAIVAVIDELADLLLGPGREVAGLVHRLASEGPAQGIYLVVATHRPSVDVCTQAIKAGFAARLALRVASTLDSRTILDQPGAHRLLEHGDALVRLAAEQEPVRVQLPELSSEALEAVVAHVRQQPPAATSRSQGGSNRSEAATFVEPTATSAGAGHAAASASASATCSDVAVPIAVLREEALAMPEAPAAPASSDELELPAAAAHVPDTQAFVSEEQLDCEVDAEVDAEVDPNAETVVDEPLLIEAVRAEAEAALGELADDDAEEPALSLWESADSGAWHIAEAEPLPTEGEALPTLLFPVDSAAELGGSEAHALPAEPAHPSEIRDLELDAELDAWSAAAGSERWSAAEALSAEPEVAPDSAAWHEETAGELHDLRLCSAIKLATEAGGCCPAMLEQALGLPSDEANELLGQLESAGILEPGRGGRRRRLRKRQAG